MADDTFDGNTDAAPLDGDEIIPCIDDPSGTPVDGRFTPADLATYLGTGTVMTGLYLTWDATDGITVGTGQCYAENGDNIAVNSAIAKTGLSLSASTWYYVYVYLSGGSPAAEVVTTAPAAWTGTAYSKTGDTSRRYVGSVLTNGSSQIIKFFHTENRMNYSAVLSAAPHRILDAGAGTTNPTGVDITGAVPTTVSDNAILIVNNAAAATVARMENSAGAILFGVSAGTRMEFNAWIEAGSIYYANSDASGTTYIDVYGYVVSR